MFVMPNFPSLDDETGFEMHEESDRAWMILYPEDYDDFMFDGEDNLAILLDEEQCLEVMRLAENGIDICRGEFDESG